MRKLLLISLIFIGLGQLWAQEDKDFLLTKEGLISDFKLASDILKKQHPHPYKFVDSVRLEQQLDSLMRLAHQEEDLYAILRYSPLQLFRDVHTKLQLSPENSRQTIRDTRFFPFPVVIEKDKIFVNGKGSSVPYGAEILEINGQNTAAIMRLLAASSYSDGFISTGTDRFYGDFQSVWGYYNASPKQYSVRYRPAGSNKEQEQVLLALDPSKGVHSSRLGIAPFNRLETSYYVYGTYIDKESTGILTVMSFALDESFAYKEFSEFFKEVKKRGIRHVIVDIRKNGGGNPAISALLYSFLASESFDNVYNQRTKTISIAYPEYAINNGRKMSDEDIRNMYNFMNQRFNKDSLTGFYVGNARLKESQLENYPPDKDAFKGSVYVLTSGATVSAATYFASLVQKNKRGLVIGKETGSGEQSTTAAWFLNYQLPNTKSILTVPMSEMYFFNAQTDNGRGVMPDRELSIDDFLKYFRSERDPEISYTRDLIREKL
ncbi:S41 family peptidase [Sphingobacterium paucimobilis]|uniref:Tail specific protease domain-containing protein n=1 Tax=Sphingobacterium paucimobilis HER1398 TaxID=1346330 RepID=U2J809_9SPHI|nr:S41 family peptidase [Sphingobacterium paucimobilis]ERJ58798.1 hypothetical protein M472_08455 [Sphingobacterium paucimobilis HER1398]